MTTIYQLNILEELKWDKNLKIPLSDKPNSEIEDEMHKTAEVLETEKVELHTAEVSVANLNRLLVDCGRQLKETQNLLAARKNEFESANRMYKLAVQDKQRFCRDVQRTEKELDDLNKLDDKLQKSKEDKMELIEQIKKELDWDEQVMEAWVNDCKRLEDDSNILQKYTRHDDEKLKTLDILMSNRFQDLNKIRKQSEMQRDEILSTQYMLDNMAGVFRTAHESRNQLITNWEKTLEQMITRDRQIQDLANRLLEAKRELKEKEFESKEKDNFLHAQQENNKMTRLKTSRLLEKRSSFMEELQELEKICHHLQSDYNICRTTVRSTSNALDQTRAEISLHKKTIDEKTTQLTNLNIDCEMLRDRLEMCNSKTKTVEERLHIYDKMVKEDSLCQELILRRLHNLYTVVENSKVELNAKRDVEKGLILEQENLQGLLKTLQKQINTADELSLRQFDKMFDQGYKLLHLERKYQAMTGDNLSLIEKRKLDDKISAALKELNEKQKNHHLIDMQLNELKKERKLAYEEKNRVDAIERTQRDEIHSAKCALEITRAIKRKRRAEKNNLLTDANILQLRLDQLAIQFQQKSMDVVHLESERLQLDTAMKERFILVKSQHEQLALVLKDLEMERHKLVCELSERMLQINNHKLKYETALLPMQTDLNMDESAPLKYVMKFVAERQELVQKGDLLNAEVTKTEKETAALANTLHLLQMHNSIQFENTATVSPHDQDLNKIQELKEELTEKSIYRRGKQRNVKSLKEENQKLESTLNKLKKDENVMLKLVQTKERDARGLEKDVKHNAAMLQRSIEMCNRIFRRMRSAAKTIDCLPEEFDMDVRQLVDMNREASCKLIEANKEFPEMADRLNQFLDQCDVDFCVAKFPSRTDSYSTVKTLSKSMVSGKGTPRVASEFLFGTVDQGKSEQDITLRFSTSRSSTYVCSSTSSPTSSTSSRKK